jgi:hypothetical protein
LWVAAFYFAAKQVVDVEDKLFAFGVVLEVILGDLDEVANSINDDFVSRFLDGALEEEVVGNFSFGFDKLQERLTHLQVWTPF